MGVEAVRGTGGLGLAGGVSYLGGRRVAPRPAAPDSLDRLARSIRHGAPGPDAIPSIDRPQFVPAAKARFLASEEVRGVDPFG